MTLPFLDRTPALLISPLLLPVVISPSRTNSFHSWLSPSRLNATWNIQSNEELSLINSKIYMLSIYFLVYIPVNNFSVFRGITIMYSQTENLHQDVNLNICNFPIFCLIFMEFSHWRSFCLIFNWERSNIRPHIGIGKSLQWHLNANATDDHGVCTKTYVRAAEVLLRLRIPYCVA